MRISTNLIIHIFLALTSGTLAKSKSVSKNPYNSLANYLSKTISIDKDETETFPIPKIQSTLSALSKSQSALKSIDGASHEFYQRSHSNTVKGSSGRVERSAGRVGCCADSLLGCELLDWMDTYTYTSTDCCDTDTDTDTDTNTDTTVVDSNSISHTDPNLDEGGDNYDDRTLDLLNRKVVLNTTISDPIPIQIIVLYEDDYSGGAGMNHGGIDGLTISTSSSPASSQKKRGRYLILLKDEYGHDLEKTLGCLDSKPEFFELDIGLVSGEVASVNKALWHAAKNVLEACRAFWDIDKDVETAESSNNDENRNQSNELEEEEREGQPEKDERNKDEAVVPMNGTKKKESDPDTLPALHFVGRSLAGGVASVAAGIADGSFPMPKTERRRKKRSNSRNQTRKSSHGGTRTQRKRRRSRSRRTQDLEETGELDQDQDSGDATIKVTSLEGGFGRGRSSALALGPPPSVSANIKAAFITSVIVGDDIICRTTQQSLERLRQRAVKRLQGSVITKQVGWMADTLSLTMSSLQSHAHGSEGEEARLSILGKVYLVRPRKHGGGVSSIHEIGRGRDALRAAVLWQLNEILLSRSLWKHHSLESYMHNLDKVQLRQIDDEEDGDDEQADYDYE